MNGDSLCYQEPVTTEDWGQKVNIRDFYLFWVNWGKIYIHMQAHAKVIGSYHATILCL